MQIVVQPLSVSGKKESWISIARDEKDEKNIKLELSKHKNPTVKSELEFIPGKEKFGKLPAGRDAAQFEGTLWVAVVAEEDVGRIRKMLNRSPPILTAAKFELGFKLTLIGTKLEIENIRITWDAGTLVKTIPRKELEQVYSTVFCAKIPENLTKDVDKQALLLFELLRGSTISIG